MINFQSDYIHYDKCGAQPSLALVPDTSGQLKHAYKNALLYLLMNIMFQKINGQKLEIQKIIFLKLKLPEYKNSKKYLRKSKKIENKCSISCKK